MKKILITSLLLCIAACGCQHKKDFPKKENKPAAVEEIKTPEEIAAEKARFERDKAQAKKLLEEGKIMPPRPTIRFEVLEHNDKISQNDAELGFEFVKGAVTACYKRVLAFIPESKGDTTLHLEAIGNRMSKATVVKSDITEEDFEPCVVKAFKTYPLFDGATADVKLNFTSKPPLTVEELKAINEGHGHDHGHDHGHGHEHFPGHGGEMPPFMGDGPMPGPGGAPVPPPAGGAPVPPPADGAPVPAPQAAE